MGTTAAERGSARLKVAASASAAVDFPDAGGPAIAVSIRFPALRPEMIFPTSPSVSAPMKRFSWAAQYLHEQAVCKTSRKRLMMMRSFVPSTSPSAAMGIIGINDKLLEQF